MRTLTWSGTLTARSSIAHGGRTSGTNTTFRRETLVQADGTLLPGVPVVSGSVIRGSMRRAAAQLMHAALVEERDSERLPLAVVHALRTGGSLRERRAGEDPLTGKRQAELRDLIPMLGVFGASIGTRIMSGRLYVDKGIPVTTETLHLIGDTPLPDGFAPLSVWRLIQRETYARQADVNGAEVAPLIDLDDEGELPRGGGQMQWSQETLPMGTVLIHHVVLKDATPVEQAFMLDVMRSWSATARIGGQLARGLGHVHPVYDLSVTDVFGDTTDVEEFDWRQHVRDNTDQITAALTWL